MNMEVTAERIKELKGMDSQEAFASRINATQSGVSRLLSGDPPSAATLISIAKAYDVSVDWLLGLSDNKERVRIPSAEKMTYADAIAVLDKLFWMGSIDYGVDPEMGFHIPSMIYVDDPVLTYILETREKVYDSEGYLQKAWYETTAKRYVDLEVPWWSEYMKNDFKRLFHDHPTDKDIRWFLKSHKDLADKADGYEDVPF